MKLKGVYNPETKYSVGDVVIYTDEVVYNLQHPCPAGVPPVNSMYWGKLNQVLAEAVLFIRDGLVAMKEEVSAEIPDNIDEYGVMLHSSTPDSDKQFLITVDDDGDLTATEVTDEGDGD